MSQCHDEYLPDERSVGENRSAEWVPGAQCHDSYGADVATIASDYNGHSAHFALLVDYAPGGVDCLWATGRLDWTNAGKFRELIGSTACPKIIIDLSRASTDSEGTGTLICCVEPRNGRRAASGDRGQWRLVRGVSEGRHGQGRSSGAGTGRRNRVLRPAHTNGGNITVRMKPRSSMPGENQVSGSLIPAILRTNGGDRSPSLTR